jgi:hypothetical protein
MEQNDLRPSDLLPILGSPGYVSDVTLGKRAISNLLEISTDRRFQQLSTQCHRFTTST